MITLTNPLTGRPFALFTPTHQAPAVRPAPRIRERPELAEDAQARAWAKQA